MGTLYTSYFSKLKEGKGVKISIARINPKWLSGYEISNMTNLAPSSELLFSFKNGNETEESLKKKYLNELISNPNSVRELKQLSVMLCSGKDVTVYCYEKSSDFCHRHLLGELFKEFKFKVEEI